MKEVNTFKTYQKMLSDGLVMVNAAYHGSSQSNVSCFMAQPVILMVQALLRCLQKIEAMFAISKCQMLQ